MGRQLSLVSSFSGKLVPRHFGTFATLSANSGPHPNSVGQRPCACARKVGRDTVTARVSDNRPMSSRSQALSRSFAEGETCLAAALRAIQPTISKQLHHRFRT